ncbi:MAG TPA: hypothetical protein VKA70_02235 [Blastocatellia bacterium]|nr:hypothetical protein [Blastocatellia bacterium]
MLVEFSHKELSLLVFALDGRAAANAEGQAPSCEESCPVVENMEDLFGAGGLSHEKKLARHLNNHLREALVECGMFELLALGPAQSFSEEQQSKMRQANTRLENWSCKIELAADDSELLRAAVARLPGAAWASMPRTIWRLRKKLKAR